MVKIDVDATEFREGVQRFEELKEDSSLPDPVPVDDLTEIYGINDGNVARLQESGVRTFSGLTTLPEERIKSTLGVTSRTAKRILREAKEKI
jgi:predicted flap endonuclease-1-like 5' DNA nuclease